jgi:hypothetical protein
VSACCCCASFQYCCFASSLLRQLAEDLGELLRRLGTRQRVPAGQQQQARGVEPGNAKHWEALWCNLAADMTMVLGAFASMAAAP